MRRAVWPCLALLLSAAAIFGTLEVLLRLRYRQRVLPAAPAIPGQVTLVVLGDSIAAGAPGPPAAAWPSLLAERLRTGRPATSWRVVNAGVPGDTAPLGFARFDQDAAAAGPQIALIAFGLNDCNPARYGLDRWLEAQTPGGPARSFAWRALQVRVLRWAAGLGWLSPPVVERSPQPLPRTSPEGFRKALNALLDRSAAIGTRAAMLTMTPLGDAEAARVREPFYETYNAVIRQLAGERRVPLVELAAGMPWSGLDPDGVHLSAEGQAWVADQVFEQLAGHGFWEDE